MKKLINPKELYDGSIFGMSQAVVDTESKQVFISGQVSWDKEFNVLGNTIEVQFKNTLKNLELVLTESNSSISSILNLRIYIRGEISDHLSIVGPILVNFLNGSSPAITGIGVVSLASPETLVEIEAVAKLNY